MAHKYSTLYWLEEVDRINAEIDRIKNEIDAEFEIYSLKQKRSLALHRAIAEAWV